MAMPCWATSAWPERLDDFGAAEWADYTRRVGEPNTRPERPYGAYAVETRKRRKTEPLAAEPSGRCPFAGGAA